MDPKSPLIGKWRKYWCDRITIEPDKQFCCEYTETEFSEEFDFPVMYGEGTIKTMKMKCEHFPGRVRHFIRDGGNEATYEIEGDILTLTDCRGYIFKLKRIV